MFPFGGFLDGDADDAVVVGRQAVTAGVGSQSAVLSASPLNAVVGDIAVVTCHGGAPSAAGGGAWIAITNPAPVLGTLYWRPLTSANVAGTVTPGATNVPWQIMIVRGAVSLTSVVSSSSSPAAGVTRDPNHAGFVGLVTETSGGSPTITGFTNIAGLVGPLTSGPNTYDGRLVYRTAPPAAPYVNGTAFAFTSQWAVIAELRR